MDSFTLSCILFLTFSHFLSLPLSLVTAYIYTYSVCVCVCVCLCVLSYSLPFIIISVWLTILSICPLLWNKTWIHYSFIQTYLSSPHSAACLLSAELFLIVLQLFSTRTVPSEHTTTLGEYILAVQALTRVVCEAVKIPLGDSPVITIAVPA